jgi:signal transduction histidine kinase
LNVLAAEMTANPRNMLQKLVEAALDLCHAGSAGISLYEGNVFRWEALAGVMAPMRNSSMPREASPCGVCIDRDAPQLMHFPIRYFPAVPEQPPIVNLLLIPFHHRGKPVGTVWIVAHDESHHFDREDERIMASLAKFAAAGWQLWRVGEAALESNRHKDEFLAMIGHELRNPLAAIVSANDALSDRGAADPVVGRAAEIIGRQTHHVSKVLDDLIDLSRINRGELTIFKEAVEVRIVLGRAIETMRSQLESHGHRLSVQIPDGPIWLNGDLVRLAQLFSNLLDNAVKYTPDGGDITIATELANDMVRVSVTDTGIGIAQDHINSVFDLFTQLNPKTPVSGLGLGLSLVRTLASLHGGRVAVTSEGLGMGTRFTVSLPASSAPESDDRFEEVAMLSTTSEALRILLVEDNDDVSEAMEQILGMDGHTVSIARTGAQALETVRIFKPDVVLLDIGLPDMDGYQVARRIRQQTDGIKLAIVALSGYGDAHHKARDAGCDDHLVKPVQLDTLRNVLSRVANQ